MHRPDLLTGAVAVTTVAAMSSVWGNGTRKSNIVRTGTPWANAKHDALAIYLRGTVMPALMSPCRWGIIDAVSAGPRAISADVAAELPGHQGTEAPGFVRGMREVMFDTLPSYAAYLVVEPPGATAADRPATHVNGIVLDGPGALAARMAGAWAERRALMFVDPLAFGIGWSTIAAAAATGAVDTWLWYPLGIGVGAWNGTPEGWPTRWAATLDDFLGDAGWRDEVGATAGGEPLAVANGRAQVVADRLLQRLGTVFGQPAPRAVVLRDAAGDPLFACCFAGALASDLVLKFRFVNTCLTRLAADVAEPPAVAATPAGAAKAGRRRARAKPVDPT